MRSRTEKFAAIVNQNAIVNHSRSGRRDQSSVVCKTRSSEEDVKRLPLSRSTANIDQRWPLTVEGRALSVWIGRILVRIENLHLVAIHQEDSRIASSLRISFHLRRGAKFDVKLNITE